VLLLRKALSIRFGNWPIGFTLLADQGKVALTRGEWDRALGLHSFFDRADLAAGGFPQVYLRFSWGGHEGTHTIAMSTLRCLVEGRARRCTERRKPDHRSAAGLRVSCEKPAGA